MRRAAFSTALLTLAALGGLARPAGAVAIPMPTGSRVWLHFGAAVCADGTTAVGNADCIASNQLGPAPPNGIPSTIFTSGPSSVSIYAELLPDRVRSHLESLQTGAAFLRASFLDTYTVHGLDSGAFDVTVHLSADGTAYSRPSGSNHILTGQTVVVEIGTWNPADTPLLEQFRVTPFGGASAGWGGSTIVQGVPFSVPIAASTSYTLSTSVGSQFDLAYGVNLSLIRGELDLLSTATVSFDLPEGVWLTSTLGGTFGDAPEPATAALTALGLGLLAVAGRARGRSCRARNCAARRRGPRRGRDR
jgi:hypothetical protein